MTSARGITYADPEQDDRHRDIDGVLWVVCAGSATGGTEYAKELHPDRQCTAMDLLLCAGCKLPAARNKRGMTWILPLLDDATDTVWEGVQTAIPPVCEVCADLAPQACPVLRDGHVELRVREAEVIGVRGTLYPRPGQNHSPDPDALVLYDSPDLPFVVARQLIRELRDVTVVHRTPGPHPIDPRRGDRHPTHAPPVTGRAPRRVTDSPAATKDSRSATGRA
ncbi:hypothetical protein [Streptomyces zaomyceticus]|uniref:hypothetical protein n=1 Tax=Streptomyces zaomyceticus TaxID=68286 RepID=UPI002E1ED4CF